MKALTLHQQASLLKLRFPKAKPRFEKFGKNELLEFDLSLQPTPTSAAYRVRFLYAVGARPLVVVMNPQPVREAHGMPTPHLNADWTLCLYDPNNDEWSSSDPLVYTIVQWTMRWLFHYEHWLTFGEWKGDQPPPPVALPDAGATGSPAEVAA